MERHWQRDHGIHYSRFGHKQRRKRCLTLHLLAIIVVHHRHHHALPPPTSPLASHTHLCILHRHTLSRLIPPVNARLSRCHRVLMAAHLSSLISRPPRLFSRHRLLVLFPSPSRSLSLYDTFCTFNVLFSISFTSLVRGSQLIAVCIDSKKKSHTSHHRDRCIKRCLSFMPPHAHSTSAIIHSAQPSSRPQSGDEWSASQHEPQCCCGMMTRAEAAMSPYVLLCASSAVFSLYFFSSYTNINFSNSTLHRLYACITSS